MPARSTVEQRENLRNLLRMQNNLCGYCNCWLSAKKTTYDHVWPRALGAPKYRSIWNGLAVHGKCNTEKADTPPTIGVYLRHPHLLVPKELWF